VGNNRQRGMIFLVNQADAADPKSRAAALAALGAGGTAISKPYRKERQTAESGVV